MKVLQVNITGKSGSTGKIVSCIRNFLLKNHKSAPVAYSVDSIHEAGYYKISHRIELSIARRINNVLFRAYKGNPFALPRLIKIIKKEKPDIVHLHCINCECVNIYQLLSYLAGSGIKTVITHHAEFFYTGTCPYSFDCDKFVDNKCRGCQNTQYKESNLFFPKASRNWKMMYDSVNKFKKDNLIFVAVSPWVKQRSLSSPIVNNYPCEVILNGVDTQVFHYRKSTTLKLDRFTKSYEQIVVHVTSNFVPYEKTDIKGGYYVRKLAIKNPQTLFIVVAGTSEDVENMPPNLLFWGTASSQVELAELYSLANVCLLTSRKETFSMVTAESLCCGTPVVGFEAGGPESIAIKSYSKFVKYGVFDALNHVLCEFLSSDIDKEQVSNESKVVYSKEAMGEGYLKVYQKLLTQ